VLRLHLVNVGVNVDHQIRPRSPRSLPDANEVVQPKDGRRGRYTSLVAARRRMTTRNGQSILANRSQAEAIASCSASSCRCRGTGVGARSFQYGAEASSMPPSSQPPESASRSRLSIMWRQLPKTPRAPAVFVSPSSNIGGPRAVIPGLVVVVGLRG
jgi:hypothetical protein